jgi:threonyl-tRNA synthetase
MSDDNHLPIEVLRHSAAHLMAHAVLDLYPGTKTGIGPAVETGFYYDFLRDEPFIPEDLEKIEARMKEIARENVPIERLVLAKDEAVRLFEGMAQSLKVELIREKGDATVTVFRQGPFADFCLGPHAVGLGRLLEGRRARRADAADLRRRLPHREGARRPP